MMKKTLLTAIIYFCIYVSYNSEVKSQILEKTQKIHFDVPNSQVISGIGEVIDYSEGELFVTDFGRNESSGIIYILIKNSKGEWVVKQKLTNKSIQKDQRLGVHLSVSGNFAISSAPGYNDGTGIILFFKRDASGKWIQTQKISPNNLKASDWIMGPVSISEEYAFCAGVNLDKDQAHILVFRKQSDETWKLTQTILPPNNEGGFINTICNAEGYLMISWGKSVYIFSENASNQWTKVQTLQTNDNRVLYYSQNIAISGEYALIHAYMPDHPHEVHFFKRESNGFWQKKQSIAFKDGVHSVALNRDYALFGVLEDLPNGIPNNGAAYLYKKDNTDNWKKIKKLIPPEAKANNAFGLGVLLTEDDIFIGASDDKILSVSPEIWERKGAIYVIPFK